jgi:hypothetical protein
MADIKKVGMKGVGGGVGAGAGMGVGAAIVLLLRAVGISPWPEDMDFKVGVALTVLGAAMFHAGQNWWKHREN